MIEEKLLEYIIPLQYKIYLLKDLKNSYDFIYVIEIVSSIDNYQLCKDPIEFCYKTGAEVDIDVYL